MSTEEGAKKAELDFEIERYQRSFTKLPTECDNRLVARFSSGSSYSYSYSAARQVEKLPEELSQKLSSKPCDRAIDTL